MSCPTAPIMYVSAPARDAMRRLVGSLAAQGQTEVAGDDRLAWSGQWRSICREVGVDAADYGYASAGHTGELSDLGLAEGAGQRQNPGGNRCVTPAVRAVHESREDERVLEPLTAEDIEIIAAQLQRPPRGLAGLVYRCPCGKPAVAPPSQGLLTVRRSTTYYPPARGRMPPARAWSREG